MEGGALVGVFLLLVSGCWRADRPAAQPRSSDAVAGPANVARHSPNPKTPVQIDYPRKGALFPPDIVAPTFHWKDDAPGAGLWRIEFAFDDGDPIDFTASCPEWTPPDVDWETIKRRCVKKTAEVTIRGASRREPSVALSEGKVSIGVCGDPVDAPLFYREVNLPFLEAVKNPAAHIRWRFGPISSQEPPPAVLENLIVCGNCHSFSADGSTLALEVDSGNDKGGYAVAEVEKEIVLDQEKVISWSDYRKEDGDVTFGLLCQVSPDGRYVVGTVKDRALAVYRPDITFSQLFFLVKGILAIYDRQTKTFQALPGADDPRYVQTNATWSPDGKEIVFARSEAYEPPGLENIRSVLVPQEAAKDFLDGNRTFRYDLYRIPFNGGKGGKPEPVEGASNNGMSNYFAKFSPDGKWIVFCKAKSFMLLQPDSELYIVPAGGGEARRLECNTSRMNSWHSWSPNGKWLVFSSKAYSAYTQLFLTHIDEHGRSSVPVVLSRFTAPRRAANIPEFVNVENGAIRRITEAFLDDHNYYRAGRAFVDQNDLRGAVPLFQKSLEINPAGVDAHLALAAVFTTLHKTEEAKTHFRRILDFRSDHPEAHQGLAALLHEEGDFEAAAEHARRALRGKPDFLKAHMTLGLVLLETGELDQSLTHFAEAARLGPEDPLPHYYRGHLLYRQGKPKEAVPSYQRALELNAAFVPALLDLASVRVLPDPAVSNLQDALAHATKACEVTGRQDPLALKTLAGVYASLGRFGDAVQAARDAHAVARTRGDPYLNASIEKMLEIYERLDAKTPKAHFDDSSKLISPPPGGTVAFSFDMPSVVYCGGSNSFAPASPGGSVASLGKSEPSGITHLLQSTSKSPTGAPTCSWLTMSLYRPLASV